MNEDDSPIETVDIPASYVIVYQRVPHQNCKVRVELSPVLKLPLSWES